MALSENSRPVLAFFKMWQFVLYFEMGSCQVTGQPEALYIVELTKNFVSQVLRLTACDWFSKLVVCK